MLTTASSVPEASAAPRYSYEYDNATQVLYQKDEENRIMNSIMILKSDIEKLFTDGKRLYQNARPSDCRFLAFNSWRTRLLLCLKTGVSAA
jgi:hypothetical protein